MVKLRRRRMNNRRTSLQGREALLTAGRNIILNGSNVDTEMAARNGRKYVSAEQRPVLGRSCSYISARSIFLAANGYGILRRPLPGENLN